MEDEGDWLNLDLSGNQPKIKESVGHNSGIITRARSGLEKVSRGDAFVEEGWLEYGAALNEGREQFPSDEQFGQWVKGNLPDTEQKAREAAMWASEDVHRYYSTKEEFPKVKTIRGLHAKFKLKTKREKEEKARKLVERQDGVTNEGEKQAIQKQLDKLVKEGVNLDKVVAGVREEDPEAKTEKKKTIAYEFVNLIVNKPDLIVSCLVALAKNEDDLRKLKGMLE